LVLDPSVPQVDPVYLLLRCPAYRHRVSFDHITTLTTVNATENGSGTEKEIGTGIEAEIVIVYLRGIVKEMV